MMNLKATKRVLCLLLSMILLFGNLPVTAKAATDYSDYSFQLYSASSGGASGPLYMKCTYLNYQWWTRLEYSNNVNDKFETRVRFEKDVSTGKYRLYYYGVHSFEKQLYTQKYYLTGATVPSAERTESNGFYYGSDYGYEYITFTTSAAGALLWEVTSSGYLKTTYKGATHYLWTTTTPTSQNAKYTFRLRTTTTAKGSRGMPVALSEYNWFWLANFHVHTPGTKQVTGTTAASCAGSAKTNQAIFCTDESCGATLKSNYYYSGSWDYDNHVELAQRRVNEQPANCQTPYSYEMETYCTGCKKVTATEGPFYEGEPNDHTYENGICTACGTGEASCGENLTWTLIDGVLTISGTGQMDGYVVLDKIPWYNYRDSMKSVIIENGVANIGRNAFWYCSSLTSIAISDSVTVIDRSAFAGCISLTSIVIPDSVTSIGQTAFWDCRNLTSIVIPDSVTSLGENAFRSLRDVYYGGTAEQWQGLINRPNAAYIHYSCTEPENHWKTEHFDATCTEDGYTYENCGCGYERNKVVIPALGHDLGEWVITTEATCTAFGEKRRDCTRCDYFETDIIGKHKFVDVVCSVCGVTGGYCGADGDNLTWTLVDGLLTISGIGPTKHWHSDEYDPEEGTYAPWYERRMDIKSAVLEEGVTIIGCCAFYDCSNLTEIDLPDGFVGVADLTFYKCTSLKSITLPGNADFCYDSFDECTSLEGIWVSDTHEEYRNDESGVVFTKDMSKLVKAPGGLSGHYEIPAGVKEIDFHAFRYCRNVESVTIPNGVTYISTGAFSYCSSLVSIEIPESVTGISLYAFAGCSSLESIDLPSSITNIDMHMFTYCSSLKSIVINDGADYIDTESFMGCTSLESIVIPASVTYIDGTAFTDCDSLTDIYYAGTAEQWKAIKYGPDAPYVHYSCTDMETHWQTVVVDATCTEDGYTYETCVCGYERNRTTEEAFGHTPVVDPAVAPNCSETGLTEGSHCATCGAVIAAQEVLPAAGHSFETQGENIVCTVCAEELYLRIPRDHVVLNPMVQSVALAPEFSPAHLADEILWTIEGDEGIVSVDQSGVVTALCEGTVHVVATLTYGRFEVSSRCRVDVTDDLKLDGIQLSTNKLTSELYSTKYAGFEILLRLPQNYGIMSTDVNEQLKDYGVSIEDACFTDAAMKELFDIVVLDDRSVQVVPTDYAVSNPSFVKGKYTGTVTVTVMGEEYVSEKLTLTVKKSKPKLKATVKAFNSFYSGQSRDIVITGGTVTEISENIKKATPIPYWLTLTDGALTLAENAPRKNLSGKAYLQVDTAEWRIPAEITLTVKNSYKAPALKLSASTVTVTKAAEDSKSALTLQLRCVNKGDTLQKLNVKSITASGGYVAENFNVSDGSFTLKAADGFKNETIQLHVAFHDTAVTVPLTLTLKSASVSLKLSRKSVTLNKGAGDRVAIAVTATPADYRITEPVFRLTNSKGADKSGELDIRYENGQIMVSATEKTPAKATYKLYVSAGGSKAVSAEIKVISAQPVVTLKNTGSMDLTFPDQTAKITAAFKNYSGDIKAYEYTVAELSGKNVVNADVSKAFLVEREGMDFHIRCIAEDEVNTANSYQVTLKLRLNDDSVAEKSISLKVKKTILKVTLKASGKLDVIRDGSAVTVTPTYPSGSGQLERTEEIFVYSSADGYQEPVNHLFSITANGKGGYRIARAEGAELDHSLKYKVKMVTKFGATEVRSALVPVVVTMGSAKLTVKTTDAKLFAGDKNDREVFRFSAKDAALNEAVRVQLKDAKYREIFEIYSYGDGAFAIGFKDGMVPESLVGKTVTLNLNVYLDGNRTAKVNTTVKLKLTICK